MKKKDSEHYQLKKAYQSTIDFEKFLRKNKIFGIKPLKILDIGTGLGANLHYFSKKNKKYEFLGLDHSKSRIKDAIKLNNNPKINFLNRDVLKRNKIKNLNFDLIMSIHTLCCFKKIEYPLKFMCSFKSKWIAINSLFYDGPLDVLVHIREHNNLLNDDNNVDSDFNIFSIQHTKKILKKYGYKIIKIKSFFPRKKIPKPKKNIRGSYTAKTEFNKYSTFSGPVYLPWHFIIAKRLS